MIKVCIKKISKSSRMTRREAETLAVKACLQALGIDDEIEHNEYGAPYLRHSPLPISVTHSRDFAAVAMGKTEDGLFGIDIEDSTRSQLFKVSSRFVSQAEAVSLNEEAKTLTKIWTAKEAVYKAIGMPVSDFKNDIVVNTENFRTAVHKVADRQFELHYRMLDDANLMCIASQGNKIEFITL